MKAISKSQMKIKLAGNGLTDDGEARSEKNKCDCGLTYAADGYGVCHGCRETLSAERAAGHMNTSSKKAKRVLAAKMKDYTPEQAAKVLQIIGDSPKGSVISPKFGGPEAWKLTPLGNLATVAHRLQYHGLTKLVEPDRGKPIMVQEGGQWVNTKLRDNYWVLDNRQLSPAEKLAADVMDYAYANYEAGWDIVVEGMTIEEIAMEVSSCKSLQEALEAIDELHVGNWVNKNLDARFGDADDEELDMYNKYEQTKLSSKAKVAHGNPQNRNNDLVGKPCVNPKCKNTLTGNEITHTRGNVRTDNSGRCQDCIAKWIPLPTAT